MNPDDQPSTPSKPPGASRPGATGMWQAPSVEEMQAMLPQYEILEILGRGGMGAVYKGRQKSLKRLVAIKILPPDAGDDEMRFVERFENEAQTMAAMNHPAIVSVYDFGETAEGLLYFIMEFVDGTDVHKMIQTSGKLGDDYALAITAHVCDALDYAHSRGVIHRDIKPANILIDQEGRVKVADFGLAKVHDPSMTSGLTRTNMAMGTPDYVAPEALSMGMVVDHRADLYAVGVMLYQMLTGEVPRGMFRMPSEKGIGTDPRFDEIICKAMESDRDHRYQTASEVRHALDVILTTPQPKNDGTGVVPLEAIPRKVVLNVPGGPIGQSAVVSSRSQAPPPKKVAGKAMAGKGAPAKGPASPSGKSSTGLWVTVVGVVAAIAVVAIFLMGGKSEPEPAAKVQPAPASLSSASPVDAAFLAQVAAAPASRQVELVEQKIEALNGTKVSAEPTIKGEKVTGLRLFRADDTEDEVPDVTPLAALKDLESLHLQYLYPTDISCLRGLKLVNLMIWGGNFNDLSALQSHPLQKLNIKQIPVSDFSVLKGKALQDLDLEWCHNLSDLSFIKGMPLKYLRVPKTKVRDLSPIAGLPLVELTCDPEAKLDPALIASIPTLKKINSKPVSEWRSGSGNAPPSVTASEAGAIKLYASSDQLPDRSGVSWDNGAVRLDKNALVYPELHSRDAILRAEIKMNPDRSSPRLTLRHPGSGKSKGLNYSVMAHGKDGTIKFDFTEASGEIKGLHEWPLPRRYGADEWMTLELRAVGDEFTVSADGKVLGTVRDSTHAEPGTASLWANANGFFRNIIYVPLDNPVPTPGKGKVIDLLALVDVKRDTIAGEWVRTAEGIAKQGPGTTDKGAPRLQLPYEPPEEYDFEVEFTAVADNQSVGQMLSTRSRTFSWIVAGNTKESPTAGFELLDNAPTSSPSDAVAPMEGNLKAGRRYVSRVEVRAGSVRGFLDGVKLVDWEGDFNRLTPGTTGTLRDDKHLGLRAARNVIFHKITVREITGTGKVDAGVVPAPSTTTPPTEEAGKGAPGKSARAPLASATKDAPFENSLGMKFVPVPGTEVLFCIHETRYRDYAEYAKMAKESVDGGWKIQTYDGYKIERDAGDHPVTSVNWNDSQAFCKWLSEKEGLTYRLPTDREWSLAVGIGREENWKSDTTPKTVFKVLDEYPWGNTWPPPQGAGNFSDESRRAKAPRAEAMYLEGYDDGFPTTAPVMSFEANPLGLFDLSGNVQEWCEDWHSGEQNERVLRGASWLNHGLVQEGGTLLSSDRARNQPGTRGNRSGFRVVLEIAARSSASSAANSAVAPPSARNTAPTSPNGRTIDLLAQVDVKRDTITGEWSREGGDLLVKAAKPDDNGTPRLQLPYQPPEEYDFEIEFTPESGHNMVGQVISAYQRSFSWFLDAQTSAGSKAGFDRLDGIAVSSRTDGTAMRPKFLTNGQRHRSTIEVRRTGLRALFDGEELLKWGSAPSSYDRLDISQGEKLRDAMHLGLAAYDRNVRFHKITVREITGTGILDAEELDAAVHAPATWTDWLGPRLAAGQFARMPNLVVEKDGLTTDRDVTSIEFSKDSVVKGPVRMTYLLRESEGTQIVFLNPRTNETYRAEDLGSELQLYRVGEGGKNKPILASEKFPAAISRTAERTLEFSVDGNVLRATVNGTFSLSAYDATLATASGSFASINFRKGLLLKKVEIADGKETVGGAKTGAKPDEDFIRAVAAASPEEQVSLVTAKLNEINGSEATLVPTIMGGKVKYLRVDRKGDALLLDISPLAALKDLTDLRMLYAGPADISCLGGLPLERLEFHGGSFEDISVLKSMPLRFLGLHSLSPSSEEALDFTLLRGMKLEMLHLSSKRLVDISFIKGMPLKDLRLTGSGVRDFSPIAGMPLVHLEFDPEAKPDLALLRSIPTLKTINKIPAADYLKTPDGATATWTDWLGPRLARPGGFDGGQWKREAEGFTTEKSLAGYEVFPADTRDGAIKVTFAMRDSQGVMINVRETKVGTVQQRYTAQYTGTSLYLAHGTNRLASEPMQGELRDLPEHTLEFRFEGENLIAILNDTHRISTRHSQLTAGTCSLVLTKGVVVKKIEVQTPTPTPAR